jgi:hypothetical protein
MDSDYPDNHSMSLMDQWTSLEDITGMLFIGILTAGLISFYWYQVKSEPKIGVLLTKLDP